MSWSEGINWIKDNAVSLSIITSLIGLLISSLAANGIPGLCLNFYKEINVRKQNERESYEKYLTKVKDFLENSSGDFKKDNQNLRYLRQLTIEEIESISKNKKRIERMIDHLADSLLLKLGNNEASNSLGSPGLFFGVKLRGLNFDGIQNLTNADFRESTLYEVSFRKADISNASFDGAYLNNVDFRGSILKGASFRRATVDDIKFLSKQVSSKRKLIDNLDLTGIVIKNAKFYTIPDPLINSIFALTANGYDLEKEIFEEVDFYNAQFIGANLKSTMWKKSNLRGAEFEASNMIGSSFLDCNLSNVYFSIWTKLDGADFTNSNLDNAVFSCHISSAQRVVFEGASLKGAKFSFYKPRHYKTIKINLSDSTFRGADLTKVKLENAILRGVDFSGSKIINANFKKANLNDADLSNALIESSDFKGAQYSQATKFPIGFSPIDNEMITTD